jgi:GTP cyclohydrolase IA
MNDLQATAQKLCINLGINLNEDNFRDTPKRFAETYKDMCRYYTTEGREELEQVLSVVFKTNYKGMIIQEPIRIYSLCSHHLLPVTYDILFGYIVKDYSLGFSKSIKALEIIAARPISQEDFTQEAVNIFERVLKPRGIMMVVRGEHSCMKIRSAKSDALNITSAVTGDFQEFESSKNEFLNLAKLKLNI